MFLDKSCDSEILYNAINVCERYNELSLNTTTLKHIYSNMVLVVV